MTTLVRVYRNLNNGKISILDKKTNKVVGYAKSCFVIPMDNQTTIKCVVLEGGRNRVLRDKQKNVHAFIEGAIGAIVDFEPLKGRTFVGSKQSATRSNVEICYCPYEMASFYRQNNKQPVQTLITCTVNSDGSMQAKIK